MSTVPLADPMEASNEDRLYVALYARGELDQESYHWALISGPKIEVEGGWGVRYHVIQKYDPANFPYRLWHYEALEIPLTQSGMLLARIVVGEVANKTQLAVTLAAVPVVQDDPTWKCRYWVRDAIAALDLDNTSLGARVVDWPKIEQKAIGYVAEKRQQKRYDGTGMLKGAIVPIYDMLEEKEITA